MPEVQKILPKKGSVMLPHIPNPDKLPWNNELTVNVDVLQTEFKSVSFECGEEIKTKSSGGRCELGGAEKFSKSAEARCRES